MHHRALSRALVALLACLPSAAFAESEHREPGHAPEEIVVTGSPLEKSADELTQPVEVLTGDELLLDTEPTLGETLAKQPGLSSSYFGPGASRPVIRGLDADHIRLLQNGLGSIDASAASPDHAVTIDPLAVERIEVLRGPAALLYGPTGVGGAVNVIDNRIPDEPFDGVSGLLEGSHDSVDRGANGALVLEGGAGGFQVHADGLSHRSRDLTIPGYARSSRERRRDPLPPGEREQKRSLANSRIDTDGGALGVSWAGEAGWIGVAPSAFDSNYGTVKEEDVTVDMRQRRWDFAGGVREPLAGVDQLRARFASSDYQHVEFEGAEQGTVFRNRGYEGRLELLHAALGPVSGAVGAQAFRSRFSAEGEEAFLPPTVTRAYSLFAFEELTAPQTSFQFGARLDWTSIGSDTTPGFDASGRSRDRRTGAGSVGATYELDDSWALSLSGAYTQRPPLAQELFANGPHVATDAFEIGDFDLRVEQSVGFDAALKKRAGFVTGSVSAFHYHFDDFISLERSDEPPIDDLDVFRYRNVPASFTGGELELTLHLLETPEQSVHLDLRADYVRAKNRDTNEPLPRIPPLRAGAELAWHRGPFHASAGVLWADEQDRTPDDELETDGYVLLDATLEYELPVRNTTVHLFVNGTNLANQTARNSASFLRDVAPLPGRGVRTGVRLSF